MCSAEQVSCVKSDEPADALRHRHVSPAVTEILSSNDSLPRLGSPVPNLTTLAKCNRDQMAEEPQALLPNVTVV